MIKYLATASLLFAAAYLSTAPALAADPGITDTEIVIGDVEPLTGPPALLGVAASIGHKIAIAEANAAGGINGRKIKYVLEDDGYVTARTHPGRQEGDRRRQGVCPARHLRLGTIHRRDAAAGESRYPHRDRRGSGQIPLGAAAQ